MGSLTLGLCIGFSAGTVFGAWWAVGRHPRRKIRTMVVTIPLAPNEQQTRDEGGRLLDEIAEGLEFARYAESRGSLSQSVDSRGQL